MVRRRTKFTFNTLKKQTIFMRVPNYIHPRRDVTSTVYIQIYSSMLSASIRGTRIMRNDQSSKKRNV